MKVTAERIPQQSEAVLTIELESPEVEKSLEQAYHRLVQKLRIPGFRQGKAPRAILERYLGKDALLDEAIEAVFPKVYDKAMEEQKLEPVALPRVEVASREPLTFKATVPLKPTAELGDYQALKVEAEPVEVSDADVNRELEELRYRAAPWVPVVGRPAHFGDLLTLDVSGKVDGQPSIDQKGAEYILWIDNTLPVPGFARELEGLEVGKPKSFTLAFAPDHVDRRLAGKVYAFSVVAHEIQERQLAPLDDELARGVGDGYESLQQLKDTIAADLKAQAEEIALRILQARALDALVKASRVEYPQVLVDHEIDHALSEQEEDLKASRRTMDEYLSRVGKTREQLRDELRPEAIRRILASLVLGKFADAEGIQVKPEEVDAEIQSVVQQAPKSQEEVRQRLNTENVRASLSRTLRTRKALERLVELVKVETSPLKAPGAEEQPSPGPKLFLPDGTEAPSMAAPKPQTRIILPGTSQGAPDPPASSQ